MEEAYERRLLRDGVEKPREGCRPHVFHWPEKRRGWWAFAHHDAGSRATMRGLQYPGSSFTQTTRQPSGVPLQPGQRQVLDRQVQRVVGGDAAGMRDRGADCAAMADDHHVPAGMRLRQCARSPHRRGRSPRPCFRRRAVSRCRPAARTDAPGRPASPAGRHAAGPAIRRATARSDRVRRPGRLRG